MPIIEQFDLYSDHTTVVVIVVMIGT